MQRIARLLGIAVVVAVAVIGLGTASAGATSSRQFISSGTTMTLRSDCVTNASILIPNATTLDGSNHTIKAIDPPGNTFHGGGVQNAGAVANMTRLHVVGALKIAPCSPAGPLRLRGILFDGAAGEISNSAVDNVRQPNSGCQEGNAIKVRNAPYAGTHPGTKTVNIHDNTVTNYQKGGIIVNGDVLATIVRNTVGASANQAILAANSIQLAFGAKGTIENNAVKGNIWCYNDILVTAFLNYKHDFNTGNPLTIAPGAGPHVTNNTMTGTPMLASRCIPTTASRPTTP